MIITLGKFTFPSMEALKRKWRTLREAGLRLTGDDHELALEVLSHHPSGTQKKGCGVDYFEPRKADYNTTSMAVYRTDGTWETFAIELNRDPAKEAKDALRHAIRFQIDAYRASLPPTVTDPISGRVLKREDAHIDHIKPFEDLVDEWCKEEGVRLEDIVTAKQPVSSQRVLADARLADRWRDYHARHSKLRAVEPVTNLSTLRKGKVSKKR